MRKEIHGILQRRQSKPHNPKDEKIANQCFFCNQALVSGVNLISGTLNNQAALGKNNSMRPFRAELIATDGEIQRRILFVSYTKNGVYSGFCSENIQYYNTYHLDGNFFLHTNREKLEKIGNFQPLDCLKGSSQLLSAGFTTDIRTLQTIPYRFTKFDAVVTIDVRNYNGHIGCSVMLVEPKNYQALAKAAIIDIPNKSVEVHSFLECNPWLSLIIYGMKKTTK